MLEDKVKDKDLQIGPRESSRFISQKYHIWNKHFQKALGFQWTMY